MMEKNNEDMIEDIEELTSNAAGDADGLSQSQNTVTDTVNTETSSRTSDIDEIMADVELVMTTEIDPTQVEAQLEKIRKKKSKKPALIEEEKDIKPEERRALRHQKRKHDTAVALIVTVVLVVAIAVGTIFGKGALDSYLDTQQEELQEEVLVEVTPEPEIIEFTPEVLSPTEAIEDDPIEQLPEEPTQDESEEEILDKMITQMIDQMTLEEKVAGLFIITPEALTGQSNVTKAGEGTQAALQDYPIGGVIYFASNIKNENQVKEMIGNTASYSRFPLFFAVDEEGGKTTRVQAGLKLNKIPSAKELGDAGDIDAVYDAYTTIGTYLSEYGFNLDFAPVADVLTNTNNVTIGERSFSDDTDVVSRMIPSAIAGLQDTNVSACLKHWPGQGDVNVDTHEGLAITERTRPEMEMTEFPPFKAGIEAGVDMVMVGHIAAPKITGDNTPCSLSKDIITGILRDEYEYDGIIITDALNMSAVCEYYGADEAAIKALKSGCDMLLMPEDFVLAYEGVVEAVKDGTIDEQRINDSLKRVYRVKYADILNDM